MPHDLAKRWRLKPVDEATAKRFAEELKLSPLIARILTLRGFTDNDATRCYLSSSLRSDLPSPFEMADMDAAVRRIVDAVRNQEQIGIWGDYDVDGTTGASVLVSFLREIGAQPIYHVPHRIEEGYGLNVEGLKRLQERGADLSSRSIAASPMPEKSPRRTTSVSISSSSIIISRPTSCRRRWRWSIPIARIVRFPDKGMCAAGLAFYLVIGLRAKLREAGWFKNGAAPDIRHFLDIVTLGTIADMVPLKGVNRTLIKRGLVELATSTRPGVVALKQVAGIADGEVSAGQVGFRLGPRINAAGRVDYGIKVVELLTTDSSETAQRIAQELEEHNLERRAIEAEVQQHALAQAEAAVAGGDRHSLVLAGEGWHPGVLGIVASRVVERFYRPTVVIGFNDGVGKGSARSIRGFHMVEAFRGCAEHLEKFGGHEFAGGLSIARSSWRRSPRLSKQAARQTAFRRATCRRSWRSMRSWISRS